MPHPRLPASQVTPEYEDAGLFKARTVQIMVELIPQMRLNSRNDLTVRGFVDRHFEIEVLFAGRRMPEAAPLEERLKAMLEHARKQAALQGHAVDIHLIRCPVRVEGSWRRRSTRDENDWETHSYQLLAARWSLLDKSGSPVPFGEQPLVHPPREEPGE
ncbi:MAG: hypothetical protein AAF636_03195 [Pseudomonadota bacterium]